MNNTQSPNLEMLEGIFNLIKDQFKVGADVPNAEQDFCILISCTQEANVGIGAKMKTHVSNMGNSRSMIQALSQIFKHDDNIRQIFKFALRNAEGEGEGEGEDDGLEEALGGLAELFSSMIKERTGETGNPWKEHIESMRKRNEEMQDKQR